MPSLQLGLSLWSALKEIGAWIIVTPAFLALEATSTELANMLVDSMTGLTASWSLPPFFDPKYLPNRKIEWHTINRKGARRSNQGGTSLWRSEKRWIGFWTQLLGGCSRTMRPEDFCLERKPLLLYGTHRDSRPDGSFSPTSFDRRSSRYNPCCRL